MHRSWCAFYLVPTLCKGVASLGGEDHPLHLATPVVIPTLSDALLTVFSKRIIRLSEKGDRERGMKQTRELQTVNRARTHIGKHFKSAFENTDQLMNRL